MTSRHLDGRGKGEFDYDYSHDILSFKIKDREYDRSIELDNIVVDIDTQKFLTGIQILEASKFLRIPKIALRKIPRWEFCAGVDENKIEIRLTFQTIFRNQLIEKNPILIEPLKESLPNSEMVCAIA
jgi:uncharacterized protein YuzE